jgi:hypothetical protein
MAPEEAIMATLNLGRNDRCWCGSGKKYKRCHLDRGRMQPLRPDQIDSRFRGAYSEEYCLHPDAPGQCSPTFINAHTVQNHGQLDRISENGHVMGVDRSSYLNYSKGRPPFVPIGVNEASTYRCFCHKHDCETFRPIEGVKAGFQFTPEQWFLLGYRAVCRGVYLARQQLKTIPLLRDLDRGEPIGDQQRIQNEVSKWEDGVRATQEVFEQLKRCYDDVLRNKGFGDLAFFALELDKVPDILGSNVFRPTCDFAGNRLQSLARGSPSDVLTFSLIATSGEGGAAAFVWHKQHDKACRAFVTSLRNLPANEIPHAITRVAFSFCENSYFSPLWWNGLSPETREALIRRFREGLRGHNNSSLMHDGVRAVGWSVTGFRQSEVVAGS